MPQVSAEAWVPISPDAAFAVSQTHGELRLRWDPFIRRQYFLRGATHPGKGVHTMTHARLGPRMESEYVSYRPPTSVGMTMVSGPWFFERFGGGWRFVAETAPDGGPGTRATWKYTFSTQPALLRPVADRVGTVVLGREIRRRIDAFAAACRDEAVVAAALAASA